MRLGRYGIYNIRIHIAVGLLPTNIQVNLSCLRAYLHITSCVSSTLHISGFLSCPSYIIAWKQNNRNYNHNKRENRRINNSRKLLNWQPLVSKNWLYKMRNENRIKCLRVDSRRSTTCCSIMSTLYLGLLLRHNLGLCIGTTIYVATKSFCELKKKYSKYLIEKIHWKTCLPTTQFLTFFRSISNKIYRKTGEIAPKNVWKID